MRKSQGTLWSVLTLALLAHLGALQARGGQTTLHAARPLTTRFVKRQPRLTKPLELKKLPGPRRRQIQRTMVTVRARRAGERVSGRIGAGRAFRGLSRPDVHVARVIAAPGLDMEPQTVAQRVVGTREAEHVVDTSLEMVDIDALDTGQYQAIVIQDPSDKRNIKGYLHLAVAYPFSVRKQNTWGHHDRLINGLRRLVGRLNEWTDVEAALSKAVTFDSSEFFKTPWAYLNITFSMDPTQGEVESLGRYLLGGGFFFFEGYNWQQCQGERYLTQFVISALEFQGYRQGVEWTFQSLPNTHPIFSCYYDFPDGIPIGHVVVIKSRGTGRDDDILPWNRAIEIGGRVVAFNTNQVYVFAWSDWGNPRAPSLSADYTQYDPTLQFQFGINTIIFALTQEGSITRRVMDRVR